ncbi:hypothetical protein BBF96_02270 [Anoxybacter fermentans]|uniref:Uncharacterized protein n=1 Tax=Anoxybacter fermentans TaxID=1323375 RepID=A0A3S9SVM2_9FIRM|nr:gamma-glutamyl-gamma-aminobutyrate hydrolase family protein [Anoxybacter fermentans]AZR72319.1 hypothetical protein BBF96_02270 [Anoxybacter fermentans]
MRKVIGITSSQQTVNDPLEFTLPKLYVRAIENVGGLPLILPIIDKDVALIAEMVERVDGILLTGGVDVDPMLFGEEPHTEMGRIDPERDFFELHLAKIALEKNLPILGICRGCQVLNVAAGGTIVQDIPSFYGKDKVHKHKQTAPRWYPTHSVEIVKGSKLEAIFKTNKITVNSYHHQSVKEPAPGFIVSAKAKDGIIEAIEGIEYKYALGIQWHPELMWQKYPQFKNLFQSFIDAC